MGKGRTGRRPTKAERGDPIDVHVGARIRDRRAIIGLTRQMLAVRIGVGVLSVQKYEQGEVRVTASVLWRIAQALDVPPGFFFEGLSDAPASQAGDERIALRVVGPLMSLPPFLQEQIIRLIQDVARVHGAKPTKRPR